MDLPVETQIRWIVQRTASLLGLGAEPVRGLVLPTGEFFPDAFDGTPRAVANLLTRVQEHAGLADLDVELSIVTPEGETKKVGCCGGGCHEGADGKAEEGEGCACSSGKGEKKGKHGKHGKHEHAKGGHGGGDCCGGGGSAKPDLKLERATRRKDGSWTVNVSSGEVGNPVVLTTALVRAVSAMFMSESGAYDDIPPPEREPAIDLSAVLLGFGVLVANGSYIYMKGCGGVRVASATKMPVEEVTLALALFCTLHRIPARTAAKHLEVTPREHFDASLEWASSNASLIARLRSSRDAIEAGDFSLGAKRSWLSRALGIGGGASVSAPSDDDLAALERELGGARRKAPVDPEKARKLEELRALGDETRQGS